MQSVLILSVLALIVVDAVLLIVVFVSSRFGFSSYIRARHPDLWEDLVPVGSEHNRWRVALDASPQMRDFRVNSVDDRGDEELVERRLRANRLERLTVLSWIGTALWTVVVFGILVVL